MIQIPLFTADSNNFEFSIELDGQVITLDINYNIRAKAWFVLFTWQDGTQTGAIKAVSKFPLLVHHKAISNIPGDFLFLPIDIKADKELTYENLGVTYGLFYLTQQEIFDWKRENGV